MELVISKVNLLINITARFLVTILYKWLFPIAITFTTLIFADKEKNGFVLCVLWLFHFLAYISFPWNYENPSREKFLYLAKQNFLSVFWTLFQASFLSVFVFVVTLIYIVWYLPALGQYSIIFSTGNSALYFLSIVLANFIVTKSFNVK